MKSDEIQKIVSFFNDNTQNFHIFATNIIEYTIQMRDFMADIAKITGRKFGCSAIFVTLSRREHTISDKHDGAFL